MRLSKIEVRKLFGVFDHTISLKSEDRITILHGPNGYGKTAILLLVQSFIGNHFGKLRRIPFEQFTIEFDDGRILSVKKLVSAKKNLESNDSQHDLHFEYKAPREDSQTFKIPFESYRSSIGFPLEIIDRHIDELERVGPDAWLQSRTGKTLDIEEIIEAYGEILPRAERKNKRPTWLANLPKEIDVRLIEAQRLLNVSNRRRQRPGDSGVSMEPAVLGYARELAGNIQEIQAKYGTYSQQLDSTFPTRVIQSQNNSSDINEVLTTTLQDLEQKRQRIISAGLLANEQHTAPLIDPNAKFDDRTKSILSLYSEDIAKKLSVFDEIAGKIELFKDLIDKRFSFKRIDIQGENGFRFLTTSGLLLQPTDLSSGEQHELVLFYELLFKTKANALILIDEPELSLHVAWQVEFLKDLSRVIKLSSFDAMIATHSPQIIDDRWDLTVELKGPGM